MRRNAAKQKALDAANAPCAYEDGVGMRPFRFPQNFAPGITIDDSDADS